ncbi:MAG: 1-acyl-sn-glycerol-3-phosphate acyltransferase [Acidobacteria bacterium]|mgnify:CR=1 FL=1|nr:MAG: 1-acyl-sn-glycerol-3-phosphate acyltransferase [Acidobacteriota bacterium]REK11642.1 MAG: 1-acyl-sn-glycerol-3-phosphate acyltransferase [Acidobacteriota bacterium]
MSTLLATLANNLFLFFGTAVFGCIAILTGILGPRVAGPSLATRLWARGLLLTGGIRLDVRFERPLDPDAVYVFLCNHQGLFDIPVLLWTLPERTRFLAKRSLFHIPVFGWSLKIMGFIPVDRGDRGRARESLEEAVRQLEAGTSILIFPEQTRSGDGRILPFRRGGFVIAQKAGVPLVPIGLDGTRRIRPKGSLLVRPGRVRVRYGEPIPMPRGDGARVGRELVDEVRHRIAGLAGASLSDVAEPAESDAADDAEQGTAAAPPAATDAAAQRQGPQRGG